MIGIGINENVVLVGTKINDKGSLVLVWDELKNLTSAEKKLSVFEESQSAKVTNDGKTTYDLLLFPLKKPEGPRNSDKTDAELLEMISGDIKRVKNQLSHILEQYTSLEGITWDPYFQTGVTNENYAEKYLDNSVLETMFSNYANQFIKMFEPFVGKVEYAMRLKLVRQSKEKNFPTINGRFLEDNPFIEPMDVPKERSRVKFTQYELDNGLDSSAAVTREAADDKTAPIADTPEAKKSIFGQR